MSTSVKWGAERSTPGPKGSLALADGRILVPGRADRSDSRLVCFESSDEGKSWIQLGTIALDPLPNADVGDGNIVRDRKGTLYAAYRHNRHGRDIKTPNYSVKVSVSEDGGRSWNAHSTVATSNPSEGPSRGLWAPFLFVRNDGAIQCYYDDEDTPFRRGFSGHQWVMMKTLDPKRKGWGEAVTVSRAHDRTHLSRDGMPSVLQVGRTRLLCAFESVQTKPPHAGLVRTVTSEDGGKTWSWLRREREVLYEPKNTRYHAFAPSLTKLPNGELLALIATNEDRPEPGISGTPPRDLFLDIKYLFSSNRGTAWEKSAKLLHKGAQGNYLPWVVRLPGKEGKVMASYLNFDRGSFTRIGTFNP